MSVMKIYLAAILTLCLGAPAFGVAGHAGIDQNVEMLKSELVQADATQAEIEICDDYVIQRGRISDQIEALAALDSRLAQAKARAHRLNFLRELSMATASVTLAASASSWLATGYSKSFLDREVEFVQLSIDASISTIRASMLKINQLCR